jgi:hypothetical protein
MKCYHQRSNEGCYLSSIEIFGALNSNISLQNNDPVLLSVEPDSFEDEVHFSLAHFVDTTAMQ